MATGSIKLPIQTTPPYNTWTRPKDWLPIPSIASGEQVIYMLLAVYEGVDNFLAFLVQGDYTVNWGNGTVTNYASNTKAENNISWASVPASTLTLDGYRQTLVKITPQAGQNITNLNLSQFHSSSITGRAVNVLDIVVNCPNMNGSIIIAPTSIAYFYSCQRVKIIELLAKNSFPNIANQMTSLKIFDCDLSNATTFANLMTASGNAIIEPIVNASGVSASSMFSSSRIEKINHPNFAPSSLASFAPNAVWLIECEIRGDLVTSTSASTFSTCRSLIRLKLNGLKYGFSVNGANLGGNALNVLGTSLGTAAGSQTIDLRLNPGISDPAFDPTIFTNKGFTLLTV
jgi:hypothetical protein